MTYKLFMAVLLLTPLCVFAFGILLFLSIEKIRKMFESEVQND